MPKATTTSITIGASAPGSTRRQVLGGATLAALMGGTFGAAVVLPDLGEAFLTAASPDALLLTLCAEAMRLDQAAEALSGAEEDAALRQWFVVAGQIAATPSRTPTGVRAKAGIVRHLMTPTARLPEGYEGKWDEGAVYGPLTWSLVNDLAAVA